MRTLSDEFIANELRYQRYQARLQLPDETDVPGEIVSFSVTSLLNGSTESLSLGAAVAATLTCTIASPGTVLQDTKVRLYIGRTVGDVLYEIPFGVYTITSVQDNEGQVKLTGYDAMATDMEMGYFPSGNPVTAKEVLADLCTQAGIGLVIPTDVTDVSVVVSDGYTRREIIGYMAALLGCNACMGDQGELVLRWFTNSGLTVDGDTIYASGLELSDSDWTLGKIECTATTSTVVTDTDEDGYTLTFTNTDTQTLTAGAGATGLSLSNPWMTQGALDGIFQRIGGLTYRSGTASFFGDLRHEAGDIITVTDYNGVSHMFPIMQITQEYDGGLKTSVAAYSKSETESSVNANGPLTQAVERYAAELALFQTVMADNLTVTNAKIGDLSATNATLQNAIIGKADITALTAIQATIEELAASTVSSSYLSANYLTAGEIAAGYASINTLEAEIAALDTIYAKTASVTALLADYATVTDLNAVSATISSLDATYAAIDFANVNVANIANGFVSNLLIAQGLVSDSLTAESANITGYLTGVGIVANSITAGTLDCGNITVTNLSVANLTVGNLNGLSLAGTVLSANNLEDLLTTVIGAVNNNDSEISAALDEIETVTAIANGKTTAYYAASAPSATEYDLSVNDIWFDTDDGNAMSRWSGTAWEPCQYGTEALAAGCVTTELLAASAVTAGKIAAGAVTTDALAAGSVTADKILAGTITSTQIAAGTITGSNIAASTITGSLIASGTITADNIVSETITATQIAAGTITGNKIAANTITAGNIVAGTITSTELAAGAVTAEKISVSELSALGATIGGFTIGTTAIYSSADAFGTTANNIYIGTSGISLGTAFRVTPAGAVTATSGTIGAITLNTNGIYSYNSNYSSSYAGWYRPGTITTSTTCFYAGATSNAGASASFSVTYGGVLTATGATISGTLTSEDGRYKTMLSGGKLAMYYDSTHYGSFASDYWVQDATKRGISMQLTSAASYMGFSYDENNDGTYIWDYVINHGTIGGYTERHLFYYSVRFVGEVTFSSTATFSYPATFSNTVTFSSHIYLSNARYIYWANSSGSNVAVIYLSASDYFYLGNTSYATYLRGSGITISGAATFSSTATFSSHIYLSNTRYIYWANSSGTNVGMIYLSSSNYFYLGNTSYPAYLRGSTLNLSGPINTAVYLNNNRVIYWYNTSGTAVALLYLNTNNTLGVGSGSCATYIAGSTITSNVAISTSSDARLKTGFTTLDHYEGLFDSLSPVAYRYISDPDTLRFGFTTQEVAAALESNGFSSQDYGLLGEWTGEDGETYGSLAYSELIPLLWHEVQRLRAKVAALESVNSGLTA